MMNTSLTKKWLSIFVVIVMLLSVCCISVSAASPYTLELKQPEIQDGKAIVTVDVTEDSNIGGMTLYVKYDDTKVSVKNVDSDVTSNFEKATVMALDSESTVKIIFAYLNTEAKNVTDPFNVQIAFDVKDGSNTGNFELTLENAFAYTSDGTEDILSSATVKGGEVGTGEEGGDINDGSDEPDGDTPVQNPSENDDASSAVGDGNKINGILTDDTGATQGGETVIIFDADGNELGSVITEEDGSFVFESDEIEDGASYTVVPESSLPEQSNPAGDTQEDAQNDDASDNTDDGKKGSSLWIIILIIAILLIGGGLGLWYFFSQKSSSNEEAPEAYEEEYTYDTEAYDVGVVDTEAVDYEAPAEDGVDQDN